jgi:hypothetical protein
MSGIPSGVNENSPLKGSPISAFCRAGMSSWASRHGFSKYSGVKFMTEGITSASPQRGISSGEMGKAWCW